MHTLHVVGDSISIHYGPYLRQYLSGVAEYSRKQADPVPYGESEPANGGDSSRVLRYLQWRRECGDRWDSLVVNCGLHDLKTDPVSQANQVPLDVYQDNLGQILHLGPSIASRVIWVRTTPVVDAIHNTRETAFYRFAADVERYNAAADRVMRENGIPAIDLWGFTRNLGVDVYVDHVHYHETVRQLHAAFVAGCLMTLLFEI